MITITAILKTKSGHEKTMQDGLLRVAENVQKSEPETVGFFVSQDLSNPRIFTTYERFKNKKAMDAHNNSETVARFFEIATPILDGDVLLFTSKEIFQK